MTVLKMTTTSLEKRIVIIPSLFLNYESHEEFKFAISFAWLSGIITFSLYHVNDEDL